MKMEDNESTQDIKAVLELLTLLQASRPSPNPNDEGGKAKEKETKCNEATLPSSRSNEDILYTRAQVELEIKKALSAEKNKQRIKTQLVKAQERCRALEEELQRKQ